jgi:flagellar assembly protein FliH
MPSSPEAIAVWELAELRAGSRAPAPVHAAFAPAHEPTQPPIFEVAAAQGVPEELLRTARVAAQSAGYAAGWASGIRAARSIADAEAHAARAERERALHAQSEAFSRAMTALDDAASALEQRAVPSAEQLEDMIISSALAIAEALVGRELDDASTRGNDALRRALALAPHDEDVTVALSPADYAIVTANPPSAQGIGRSISIAEDDSLEPGDAVAACGATSIDARLSTGLQRVREVLGQ